MTKKNYSEFIRFILSGLVNTATSYAIYYLLLLVVSYQVAFFASSLLGIIISYYINTIFTFKEKIQLSKLMQYPLVYIVQYITGAIGLWFFVEKLGCNRYVIPIVITIMNIPLTFLMSRRIIKQGVYS